MFLHKSLCCRRCYKVINANIIDSIPRHNDGFSKIENVIIPTIRWSIPPFLLQIYNFIDSRYKHRQVYHFNAGAGANGCFFCSNQYFLQFHKLFNSHAKYNPSISTHCSIGCFVNFQLLKNRNGQALSQSVIKSSNGYIL